MALTEAEDRGYKGPRQKQLERIGKQQEEHCVRAHRQKLGQKDGLGWRGLCKELEFPLRGSKKAPERSDHKRRHIQECLGASF